MALDEFGLIRQYFDWKPTQSSSVLGVGDDAALLLLASSQQLVVTTDTLLEDRHFDQSSTPRDLGWKSLAVSLSDLAAMGAQPLGFTLALSLPEVKLAWLQEFSAGLKQAAATYGLDLVGGDTTRGKLAITITAMGQVPAGTALLRSGAQAGDRIWVSGTLGDAALALARGVAASVGLRSRLDRPQPRVASGQRLRGALHAALDISDGLSSDLNHLLVASQAGATIHWTALPRSEAFAAAVGDDEQAQSCLLHGGDDYELLVSAPADVDVQQRDPDVRWTPIGQVEATPGMRIDWGQGRVETLTPAAWNHFA